jgi:hypothetical protein
MFQNPMMAMPGMNMQQPFMAGMPTPGFMPDMNGMHNPGAARRGGGRFNNRPGPYDRGARNMRGGSAMGGMRGPALMPGYLALGGGGGGGKWGDGAGGGMNAMGPREAVQGRQIKSYEDLDAQPGGGGGGGRPNGGAGGEAELDY